MSAALGGMDGKRGDDRGGVERGRPVSAYERHGQLGDQAIELQLQADDLRHLRPERQQPVHVCDDPQPAVPALARLGRVAAQYAAQDRRVKLPARVRGGGVEGRRAGRGGDLIKHVSPGPEDDGPVVKSRAFGQQVRGRLHVACGIIHYPADMSAHADLIYRGAGDYLHAYKPRPKNGRDVVPRTMCHRPSGPPLTTATSPG
jgi:hypothetical protein